MFRWNKPNLLDQILFVGTNSSSPAELLTGLKKCLFREKKLLFKTILSNRQTLKSFDIHLVRVIKIPEKLRGYELVFPMGETNYTGISLWDFGGYHAMISEPTLQEIPERDDYENLFSFHLT